MVVGGGGRLALSRGDAIWGGRVGGWRRVSGVVEEEEEEARRVVGG